MSANPECPACPIEGNPSLCSFAGRVENVYISDAFESSPHTNMVVAEEEIRQGEITPDDIDRLAPALEADINLSRASCFVQLHEAAQADEEILGTLTDEKKIAVAGCATNRLRRICAL